MDKQLATLDRYTGTSASTRETLTSVQTPHTQPHTHTLTLTHTHANVHTLRCGRAS